MEGERLTALFQRRVERHVGIVMDGAVPGAGHGKAHHALLVGELLDKAGAGFGGVEGKIHQPLHPRLFGEDLFGQPAVERYKEIMR